MNTKILLVEDDASLGFVIKDNLEMKGYEVTLCNDGESGENTFLQNAFDLCILDVMMPRKDGFTVARNIRKKDQQVPILFVTAKSMLEDKVKGFSAGGDDYITKPFSVEELQMRIEVFLRRSHSKDNTDVVFRLGKFEFDSSNLTLKHDDAVRTLTQKESDVLGLLCKNRDRV